MRIVQRLVLIVLLAAIPVGILQSINLRQQYRHEHEEFARTALQTANRAAAEQGRIVDGAHQLLAALAQLPAVREGDAEACGVILRRLKAQFPIYLGIGVSNPKGEVWCSSIRPGTVVADRLYFKQAVATRRFTTGGYVIGRISGQRSLNFSLPFMQPSGALGGVLVAGLDLDALARDLGKIQLPATGRLVVAGPDRRVLMDLPGNRNVGAILPASLSAAFDAQRSGVADLNWIDGSARLVGFVPPRAEPGGPFLIAAGIDRDHVYTALAHRARLEAGTLLGTLVAALLIAWWVATRFVREPVRHLASAVRAWREGDTRARVGPMGRGSEFDDLGQAFDAMAERVDERQRLLRAVLESTTDTVITFDANWNVTFVNERGRLRLGGDELVGRTVFEVFSGAHSDEAAEAFRVAMDERRPMVIDFDYPPLNARFEANAYPTRDGGLAMFIRDISEQHRAREELRYQALHDSLTGLPNRSHAMSMAAERLAEGALSALILIDLDGFKHINDRYGHAVGDAMLREMAARLGQCAAEEAGNGCAMVARLGGDEFVALLSQRTREACIAFGQGIIERIGGEPFLVDGQLYYVTASCGVALVRDAAHEDVADLLVGADLALYRAKDAGGGGCRVYSAADRAEYEARRLLEDEVSRAVAAGEFELYFQPQVRLSDGAWVGAEALLRWRHPERGLIGPASFVEILERSRHATAVGEWVLDEACREAAAWWRRGHRLRIGVNLFAEQIRSSNLLATVEASLSRHGLPAQALELELTENIALSYEDDISGKLLALRTMGVRLAFDDFGTGFASLTTLKNIPVHRLKIDRSFIAQLPSDEHDKGIVEAVLALARTLGLEVIAEGVETFQQEEYLRVRGCEEAQGYRYARPMPARMFRAELLATHDAAAVG
jgi:diguanylate cyclase (GGDEF)-like protein/PAS domain S-box-containing protein